ncbi:L-ascorbate peroxidase 1, cytosolic [Ancistrocladus abbreviatus]
MAEKIGNLVRWYPNVSKQTARNIIRCNHSLTILICSEKCALEMLHLAFHSAYNVEKNTYGHYGRGSFTPEHSHGHCDRLEIAVKLLQPIEEEFSMLSYSDICQLAGVVALELSGGPRIPFHPGRKDQLGHFSRGCLLDATKGPDYVNNVLIKRMRLTKKDIAALFGGYSMGRCPFGPEGSRTIEPLRFSNSYFKELLGETEGGLVLPSEKALLLSDDYCSYVQKYAVDKAALLADFRVAYMKVSELPFRVAVAAALSGNINANIAKMLKTGSFSPPAAAAAANVDAKLAELSKMGSDA